MVRTVKDLKDTGPDNEWQVEIDGEDMSNVFTRLFIEETISQPADFQIDLRADIPDVTRDSLVDVQLDGEDIGRYVIRKPSEDSNLEYSLAGSDLAALFFDKNWDEEYVGSDTDPIIEDVVEDTPGIQVGDNERLNSEDGVVDARSEDDSKIKFIDNLVTHYGGEWITEKGGLVFETDGFENGNFTEDPEWTVESPGSNIEVQQDFVKNGEYSLLMSVEEGGDDAILNHETGGISIEGDEFGAWMNASISEKYYALTNTKGDIEGSDAVNITLTQLTGVSGSGWAIRATTFDENGDEIDSGTIGMDDSVEDWARVAVSFNPSAEEATFTIYNDDNVEGGSSTLDYSGVNEYDHVVLAALEDGSDEDEYFDDVVYSVSGDPDRLNVVQRLESDDVEHVFVGEDDDEDRNVEKVSVEQDFDEEYDGVVVKGYGDGDDQVKEFYPAKDELPSDPKVLKYTDKTIMSSREASTTAENLFNQHQEWQTVTVKPSDANLLLGLGDKVEIKDESTGLNDEFRVIRRQFDIDYQRGVKTFYVCGDRPVNFLDDYSGLEDSSESETDYMQGSRNTWSEKEMANASPETPLKMQVRVPDDVEDTVGENKTSEILLNYETKPYKTSGAPVEETVIKDLTADQIEALKDVGVDISNYVDQVSPDSDNYETDVDQDGVAVEETNITGTTSDSSDINLDGENSFTREDFSLNNDESSGIFESVSYSGNLLVIRANIKTDEGFGEEFIVEISPSGPGDSFVSLVTKTNNGGEIHISHAQPGNFWSGSDIDFVIVNKSGGPIDVDEQTIRLEGYGTHNHDIPSSAHTTDGGDNFLSTSVSQRDDELVFDVSDQSDDAVRDVIPEQIDDDILSDIDEDQIVVAEITDDVAEGSEATEITKIEIDGETIVENTGTNQDDGIDVTEELKEPGWHEITVYPDDVTFLKTRAYLDYQKESR